MRYMGKKKMISKDERKVSIVTVSYNSVDTIEQTICSVLRQSYQNIEYIIIDGQSTDGTIDIIAKYRKCISYFVSEPDEGLYYAMNKGIQQATGDIIGIINSDDWYEPDAVERAVNCLTYNDVELAYGRKRVIFENGIKKDVEKQPIENTWYKPTVPHSTVFVKSKLYRRYGLFDTKYKIAADYELILRFYANGVRFGYIDAIITNFRNGGISTIRYMEGAEEGRQISLLYIDKCPEKELAMKQIIENYNMAKFRMIVEKSPGILGEMLRDKFKEKDGVIIFGTGFWGEWFQHMLEACNIPVKMYIDNNQRKWSMTLNGVKIYAPEALKDCQGRIVIAVRDCVSEICGQLRELNYDGISWITLDEIRESLIQ